MPRKGIFDDLFDHLSVYSARCIGVITYPEPPRIPHFRRKFKRHRLRQFDHARFGGVVIRIIRISHNAVGRCCLQITPLPCSIMCVRRLRDVEHSSEIHAITLSIPPG